MRDPEMYRQAVERIWASAERIACAGNRSEADQLTSALMDLQEAIGPEEIQQLREELKEGDRRP